MKFIVALCFLVGTVASYPKSGCGVSPISRVIGGVDAQPGNWPWQIALLRGQFICGGSLIKPDWVVTAAHCIGYPNYPYLYKVRLGEHNRNVIEGTEQIIAVKKLMVHPQYNNPRLNNDIALIQLARPATLNSRVQTVCLPSHDYDVPTSSRCFITGWGKIKHPGKAHPILQQAQMPPIKKDVCANKLSAAGSKGSSVQITDQMLCAGVEGTILSGCHGDSGGPYVCQNSAGRWVLQGTVSWGSPRCSAKERFTVFARVAKFRDWIDQHTGGGGSGGEGTLPPPPPPTVTPAPPESGFSCNFDKGFCGFSQSKNDEFDWTRRSGRTPSSNTGPSSGRGGRGSYVYIETSSPRVQDDKAKLSKKVYLSGISCLSFYYHMYGATMGSLKVTLDGQEVFRKSGNQGDKWIYSNEISLSGSGNKQLEFEGIRGSSYTGDAAIDDVRVSECQAPTPTPPQPPPPTTQVTPAPPRPSGRCGVSPISRVIDGVDARPGNWPWQVALVRDDFGYMCGGSLIKPDWVVTAAHCVGISNPKIYKIHLGDHDRKVAEGTEQIIGAKRIISHPRYNKPVRINNDIALIQLARPATLNSRVQTVCLPSHDYDVPTSSRCFISGWGKIKHPGFPHHILQQVQLPPVKSDVCAKKLAASPGGSSLQITEKMLCAGVDGASSMICHGDSGGPYVCQNSAGRWVLQGVVSWGSPRCSAKERYSVFARVTKFRNWIYQHI